MRRNNFALRLQPSLMEEARKVAESEGVALNQFINVALAEKLSAMRAEKYFQERARRANRDETLRILDRAGKGNPPRKDDELPADLTKLEIKPAKGIKSSDGPISRTGFRKRNSRRSVTR
jgi:hypothetical protein